MKTFILAATMVWGAFAISGAANAAVSQIGSPDAGYIAATTLLEIPTQEFVTFSSVSGGGYTVTFGASLESRLVGSSWATWGSPPDTESNTPWTGYSQGSTSALFTFDRTYSIFGVEAQGNPFDVQTFSAEFFLSGISQGVISREINGDAGARLLAASGSFDSVLISAPVDFAVAQFRVSDGGTVPEPATWALMITGFGLVGVASRRRALVAAR